MKRTSNAAYWENRFEQLEKAQHEAALNGYTDIEKIYRKAEREIEGQIASWYQRFAQNNDISIAEARKLLKKSDLEEFKWDVNQYIQYGQENELDGSWIKELENASAKFHISRLESLKIHTGNALEVLYKDELDKLNYRFADAYRSSYYQTAFEIQKGVGIGWDIAGVNESQLAKVLSKPWAADGRNFSERIWDNKRKLISEVHSELSRGIMLGKDPQKVIDAVAKKMNTSKSNAGRLVMTESAYFSSLAEKETFKDLGVEKYEILATLDTHTSDICRAMDGKVFPMSEYQAGVTAPPFHVNCRSTTVPYFDDNFGNIGERAARDENGKTYYVPADMTYEEWDKTFVQGDKSDLKEVTPDDTIETKTEIIQTLDKLKQSGISESDYNEYLGIINNHKNPDIIKLYKYHADEITKIEKVEEGGAYSPTNKSLKFDYINHQKYKDVPKYDTLAHEYGHFFDVEVKFDDLHFNEIESVRNATGLSTFKETASSSDEFLAAIRKDKGHIRSVYTTEVKQDLIAHDASGAVRDVIKGLFPKTELDWGHPEKYYNRIYFNIEFMDRALPTTTSRKKKLQQVYKDLGFDASNQTKVKNICRQYQVALEAWANIMSAEVNGGESLEYVKKYLPNSYATMLKILKGVK